jgi:anti-anti-sigma factor
MRTREAGVMAVGAEADFRVSRERIAAAEHIRLQGELDMAVTSMLDREMRRAEAGDASQIVLELDELEFVDAAGVRLLLELKARSASSGHKLRMTPAVSEHVQRVFQVTGARDLLPFAA